MSYIDYIKLIINFIMNLISFFKQSDNTEQEEVEEANI